MIHNGTTEKFHQINATKSASAEKGKAITAITKQPDSNNHPQTQIQPLTTFPSMFPGLAQWVKDLVLP